MNNCLGKTVRLGTPLLAIVILSPGCGRDVPVGPPVAANRATALAQGPAEVKSGNSSTGRGAPVLVLESLGVDPARPGPKTLCQLRARIRNKGRQAASSFAFEVRINGQEQTVYKNHVYMQPIAAGAVGEVQLFNFWTTESGRPTPRQLRIEVALKEARWVEVTRHGNVTDEKPLGNVEGLPVSVSWAVALGTADRGRAG